MPQTDLIPVPFTPELMVATLNDNFEKIRRALQDPLYIPNVGVEPAAPATGGFLYVFNGALKYIGSAGTRTTVAVA